MLEYLLYYCCSEIVVQRHPEIWPIKSYMETLGVWRFHLVDLNQDRTLYGTMVS